RVLGLEGYRAENLGRRRVDWQGQRLDGNKTVSEIQEVCGRRREERLAQRRRTEARARRGAQNHARSDLRARGELAVDRTAEVVVVLAAHRAAQAQPGEHVAFDIEVAGKAMA